MVLESKYRVGIIGGGPAGCICAYFLQKECEVIVFEKNSPLKTLLPTGGGRCNLAHCEYDIKELVANYPRGEKFLYSVFSKFSTADTVDFFNSIGIKTYTQEDFRIFPTSNSSADVREKFLKAIRYVNFINEKALRINCKDNLKTIVTDKGSYNFDFVIIATGGHASYNICEYLGHKIIPPKKALVGLKTAQNFSSLAGVSIKINGEDLLFTHQGISGPFAYRLSSIKAKDRFPYDITVSLYDSDIPLQELLNNSPHKDIKNVLSDILPKSLAAYILGTLNIPTSIKAHQINGKLRNKIIEKIKNFELTITGTSSGGEVVTCGGVALDEINAKTMESKLISNIYFCGEVLDIDGFCGGFNLQNCWSTGYVASQAILEKSKSSNKLL